MSGLEAKLKVLADAGFRIVPSASRDFGEPDQFRLIRVDTHTAVDELVGCASTHAITTFWTRLRAGTYRSAN